MYICLVRHRHACFLEPGKAMHGPWFHAQAEVHRQGKVYKINLQTFDDGGLRVELTQRSSMQRWRGDFSQRSEISSLTSDHC